jgi:tRNA threonylcarbamoyl adenosine modification protein YeaZ
MKSPVILAVDGTEDVLTLALLSRGKVWKKRCGAGRPHDELLIPAIDGLLRRAGLKAKDLDAVAAASGPGRFTGIRIGMAYAAVAGLSLKIPALAVSRLEALASKANASPVCAVLKGWKEERYYQFFRRSRTGRSRPQGAPLWISAEGWPAVKSRAKAAVLEGAVEAADLLTPATWQLRLKSRPAFSPLYLKAAGYEARKP